MYLDHYQLKAKPFDLSPGPRFIWLGEKHKEALATLNYGIIEDLGFLLLTGDVGAGKTALIHRLISTLDESTIVAHITDPGLGTIDFFKLLAAEFKLSGDLRGKADFLIELERFLHQAHADHRKVLLVVDEAQRLNSKLLDQIRVLSNIELSDRKLINIFFVGQPEFKNTLMDSSNRAIRQRIAINYHIHPLTESETGQYIEHRLKVAGATRRIFKPDAIREISRFSAGYPRAINTICDHALLTGYASGLKSINAGVIKECEQELNIRAGIDFSRTGRQIKPKKQPFLSTAPAARPSSSRGYSIFIGMAVVLSALAGYFFLWNEPFRKPRPVVQTPPAASLNQETKPAAREMPRPAAPTDAQPSQASRNKDVAAARPPAPSDAQAELQWNEGSDMASASLSKDENPVVSPQPPLMIPQAKPAPEPLPEIKPVDSAAALAAMSPLNPPPSSPASDAVRPTQTDSAAQQEAVEQPLPSIPRDEETTVAGRQPAPASPASDSLAVESKVSGTDPASASTGSNAPLAAAAADPQSTAKPDTEAGNSTQPDQAIPDSPPEPPAIAKADTNLQALNVPVDDDTPAGEPPDIDVLEKRLQAFLQDYCTTYAARNMGAFSSFFAPYAEENGQPFVSLIPKYQRNFNLIEAIEYRIELQEFSSDETNQTVKIEGDFFLKWLPPDKQWRENSGKIYMNLKADGSSFLVQQLDYHGSRAKTE